MRLKKLLVILLCLFIFCPGSARAVDGEKYELAVQAYYEKDFTTAEKLFLELVQEAEHSGYLFYNLGNVYFKKGELGKAVQYYEKSRLFIPRFDDLKTNLKQASDKRSVQLDDSFTDYVLRTFYFWGSFLNLSEFHVFFAAVSILFWGFLSFLVVRKKRVVTVSSLIAALLFVYTLVGFVFKQDTERPGDFGVILQDKVEAKASYLEQEQPIFVVNEGTKVRIVGSQNFGEGQKWLRIALPQGQLGWVDADAIGVI